MALSEYFPERQFRILVVDDHEISRDLTRDMLHLRGYEVWTAGNAEEAQNLVEHELPDMMILDVVMPGKSGIELCREMKDSTRTRLIPVILLTGLNDPRAKLMGIEEGADDFINKPINAQELFARVKSLLRIKQYTDELDNAEAVIMTLALSVEARDAYTQGHCARLSQHAVAMGRHLRLSGAEMVALRRAGILHDIGKIVVPDSILNKAGALTAEEWGIMRTHPMLGEKICRPMRTLEKVLPVIRHHHEHWDGSGYPDGLRGEEIPYLARILQIVDCHDALATPRPYKRALSREETRAIMRRETTAGRWDPELMPLFLNLMDHGLLEH